MLCGHRSAWWREPTSPFRPAAGREEIAAKWQRLRACTRVRHMVLGYERTSVVLSPARSRRAYMASRQASFSGCHCNCSTLILPKKYRLKRTLSPSVLAIVVRFLRNARRCQRTPLSRNSVYRYICTANQRMLCSMFPHFSFLECPTVHMCDPRLTFPRLF